MATFASVQERVRAYVLDLPAALETEIPRLVNDAIRDAQTRHNFRAMEASVELVTTNFSHTLGSIPSDYKERRSRPWLRRDNGSNKELEWAITHEHIVRMFGINDQLDHGEPFLIHETGDDFEVYPFPDMLSDFDDGEYRVNIPYWKYLPALVADTDTNWFLENGERYVVFHASAHAFMFIFQEGQASVRLQQAEGEFAKLVSQDKRSRSARNATLTPMLDVHGHRYQRRL